MIRFLIFFVFLTSLLVTLPALATGPIGAFEGQRLYVSHCLLCHGPTGQGDGPLAQSLGLTPSDLTTTVRSRSDTILKKIISGAGGPTISGRDRHNVLTESMPAWGEVLEDSQVEALIAYIRYLGKGKHDLPGDPEQGHLLYQRYCAVCHGKEGYGDGVMTQLMELEPADHTSPSAMDPLDNDELAEAILEGDGEFMPAWKGILKRDEVDALISYIRLLGQ